MPSSGFPMESFEDERNPSVPPHVTWTVIEKNAKCAMDNGLFVEWLESFVGAYNYLKLNEPTKALIDLANIASQAGVEEWDL